MRFEQTQLQKPQRGLMVCTTLIIQDGLNYQHEREYEKDPAGCKACYGTDLKGGVLGKMAETRIFLQLWSLIYLNLNLLHI